MSLGEEMIAKVRADLAKAALDDMSRRVACEVCGHKTRDLAMHDRMHGTKQAVSEENEPMPDLLQCPKGCDNDYIVDDKVYSKIVGVQINGVYDGIAYWFCPQCAAKWQRFDHGRVHDWVKENVSNIE